MKKVLTVMIDTVEDDVDSAIAALVNELHSNGHTVCQIRVMDDAGEKPLPLNTIPGVTPPPEPSPPPSSPITAPGIPATAPPSSVTDVTTTKQVEGATSDTSPKEPPITSSTGGTATGETLEGVGNEPIPEDIPTEGAQDVTTTTSPTA